MAKKEKKLTKLQEASKRILVVEAELNHWQQRFEAQHAIIHGLVEAIRPFAFARERDCFKGTATNITPCNVSDVDVQRVRAILAEQGLY